MDQFCSSSERENNAPCVTAITCGEIGGANSMEPLIYGAHSDMVIVDCDEMGRAFPELQVCPRHAELLILIAAISFWLCETRGSLRSTARNLARWSNNCNMERDRSITRRSNTEPSARRTFCAFQMVTTTIYGVPPFPAAIADYKGNTSVITHAESPKSVEAVFRLKCLRMGLVHTQSSSFWCILFSQKS